MLRAPAAGQVADLGSQLHPEEACQGGRDCRVQLHPTQALHTLASQQGHTHHPLPLALSLGGRPSPPRRTTRPPTAHHTSKGTEAVCMFHQLDLISLRNPSASCQVCLKLMEAISRPQRCVADLGCGERAPGGSTSQPQMEGGAVTSPGRFLQWSLEEVMTLVPVTLHRSFLPMRLEDILGHLCWVHSTRPDPRGVHGRAMARQLLTPKREGLYLQTGGRSQNEKEQEEGSGLKRKQREKIGQDTLRVVNASARLAPGYSANSERPSRQ